jgi:uncharacterized protein DUF3383
MLSVARLIQVSVNAGATPVVGRTFNQLMIAGDSAVISGLQRYRSYTGLQAVGGDFGVTTPEYQAAEAYFDQTPAPNQAILIGRWLSVATSGFNLGQIQTPAQQVISNWTAITSGGFDISIDGASAETLTGLNFSSVTNLNGVASVINGSLTGAVCVWNGSAFQITSNSTGPGAFATGTISLTGQPSANDHFVIQGTTVTFVASSPVGNQVVIGLTTAATVANLLAFLQASTDTNIDQATYANNSGFVITVTDKVAGTAGNSFSLTKSGSNLAVSGSTLSGGTQPSSVGYATSPGSGTDISTLLGLTASTSQGLAQGYAAESPAQCVQALAAASNLWYGITFATTTTITTAQYLAVAPLVEGLSVTRMLGITTQDPNTTSPLVMNDLASLLSAGAYNHTFTQYSSTSAFAAASLFGRMFSVNFAAQNSTINLMYKQEPGITPENLNDTQANALEAKNCNVFVGYDNNTAIIQYGVCASGNFIDQIWGSDWFQNAIQTAVFNLLYTATTKIPQTDAGQNQLVNSCSAVCGNQPGGAVYNGFAGPGTWNSSTVFGNLQTGQFLPLGYYIYSASIDSQSESDRAARKAPPIQIALKLAGAFQSADIIVTVNQ